MILRNKDIINFGPIGDWVPYEDSMSGTLEWCRENNEFIRVYATPNWQTDGVVPVDAEIDEEYVTLHTFELSLNESVEYQLNQYISVISTILSNFK